MKVLVVIPAYNEEGNIASTVNKINKIKLNNIKIDYVVINDGSTDNTKKVCIENKINYINLPINLGIGGAVQTGYKYALYNDYDIAIQFDGDGQHDANYLGKLVAEIVNGSDIAIGSRFVKELSSFKSTLVRRTGIMYLSKLIYICTGKRVCDPTSGFRAANKKIIALFAKEYPTDYPEPDTIVSIIKKGYKYSEIPVEMNEREIGKSSIGSIKYVYYAIKVSLSIIISSLSTRKGKK